MGGKGSKESKDGPARKARSPCAHNLFDLEDGREVELVSQLSASTILTQEVNLLKHEQLTLIKEHEYQQQQQQQQQQRSGHNKQKRKTTQPPSSVDSAQMKEAQRLLAQWSSVRQSLEHKFTHSQQQQGPLFALPPELVCLVLEFLDYRALLAFGLTSTRSYGLVHGDHEHHSRLVCAKLVDHIFEHYAASMADLVLKLQQQQQQQQQQDKEGEKKDEAKLKEQKVKGEEEGEEDETVSRKAAGAARLLMADALRESGRALSPFDLEHFEEALDYGFELRLKAFGSIRTFVLPKALYTFRSDLGAAVEEGLAEVECTPCMPSDVWRGDAWSYNDLVFGPELVQVTSPDYIDRVLQQGTEQVKSMEHLSNIMKETNQKIKTPTSRDALRAIGRLVGCHEVLLWHDVQFNGKGYGGHRFIAIGGSRAAIVQWEIYSNFCGGPHATYSCGMG